MKLISTRKNKRYTSIFLNECSVEAFQEAIKVYNSLEGNAIIKPTQNAYDSYLKIEKPFEKLRKYHVKKFEILGVPFSKHYERSEIFNDNPEVKYTNYEGKEVTIIAIPNYTDLLEEVFQKYTGKLLYF